MPAESPWLGRTAAAAYLGLAPRTLDRWRCSGGGPPYYKLRNYLVRYRIADLDTWVSSQPRLHTEDDGTATEILKQATILREARHMAGRRR